jgi:membrane protein
VSPGGVLAVGIWFVASAAFAFYVAHFGSYNATYGSLGGVVVFLVWMWITNVALLLGTEFNAELERGRELEAGDSQAHDEIQLPPRDERREGPGILPRIRSALTRHRKHEPSRSENMPSTEGSARSPR